MKNWLLILQQEARSWLSIWNAKHKSLYLTALIILFFTIVGWIFDVVDYQSFQLWRSDNKLWGILLIVFLLVCFIHFFIQKVVFPILIWKRLKQDFELEKWFLLMKEFSNKKANHLKLITINKYREFVNEFPKMIEQGKSIVDIQAEQLNDKQKIWQSHIKNELQKLNQYSTLHLNRVKKMEFQDKISYKRLKNLIEQFKNSKD